MLWQYGEHCKGHVTRVNFPCILQRNKRCIASYPNIFTCSTQCLQPTMLQCNAMQNVALQADSGLFQRLKTLEPRPDWSPLGV